MILLLDSENSVGRLFLCPLLIEVGKIRRDVLVIAFYKFCGLLVSRKENICISLVLVAHF
jgi:hypothetical protein